MAAIPVPSTDKPANPVTPLVTDKITDNDRRLKILERTGQAGLEARLTAIETFLGI